MSAMTTTTMMTTAMIFPTMKTPPFHDAKHTNSGFCFAFCLIGISYGRKIGECLELSLKNMKMKMMSSVKIYINQQVILTNQSGNDHMSESHGGLLKTLHWFHDFSAEGSYQDMIGYPGVEKSSRFVRWFNRRLKNETIWIAFSTSG